MNTTFASESERIRTAMDDASTVTELTSLDNDVEAFAEALLQSSNILERKLLKLKGKIALSSQQSDMARLDD